MSTQVAHHVGLAVVGDVVAGLAVLGWWLGAYETHIGAVVTTMAGIYYLIQFGKWVSKLWDNHNGD